MRVNLWLCVQSASEDLQKLLCSWPSVRGSLTTSSDFLLGLELSHVEDQIPSGSQMLAGQTNTCVGFTCCRNSVSRAATVNGVRWGWIRLISRLFLTVNPWTLSTIFFCLSGLFIFSHAHTHTHTCSIGAAEAQIIRWLFFHCAAGKNPDYWCVCVWDCL